MAAATMPDRLEPILRSADAVLEQWNGKRYAHYLNDEMGRRATERHLGIISRVSAFITAKDKAAHPEIAWKDIAGIGNVLRHRYDTVSDDRIWEIVSLNLKALRTAVKKIIKKHTGGKRKA